MSRHARICGLQLGSVGVLAVLLHLIDRSIAALDGYIPGEDYPVYTEVPDGLSFTCDDKIPGYYADPETMCQVWHWCVPSIGGNIKYSFLCGPGTVFNQRTRVCDWFFKTDCQNAQAYYGINEDLYKDEQGNFINGKNRNTSYDTTSDERRLSARKKRMEVHKTSSKTYTTIKRVKKNRRKNKENTTEEPQLAVTPLNNSNTQNLTADISNAASGFTKASPTATSISTDYFRSSSTTEANVEAL